MVNVVNPAKDGGDIALTDDLEFRCHGRDAGTFGDTDQNTAIDHIATQTNDKGRNPHIGDPETVPSANQQAKHQDHADGCEKVHLIPHLTAGCDAAQKAHGRADGHIDVAGHDDQQHSERQNAGDCGLAEQNGEISGR